MLKDIGCKMKLILASHCSLVAAVFVDKLMRKTLPVPFPFLQLNLVWVQCHHKCINNVSLLCLSMVQS